MNSVTLMCNNTNDILIQKIDTYKSICNKNVTHSVIVTLMCNNTNDIFIQKIDTCKQMCNKSVTHPVNCDTFENSIVSEL